MGRLIDPATKGRPLATAGAPSAGTTEVQTLTVTGSPTGGTFKLKFQGRTTAAIAYNANAAAIQTALRALPNIGSAGVTVTGTNPFVVTFAGSLVKKAVATMTLAVNALTGGTSPTVGIVKTTPGVTADGRGAPPGSPLAGGDGKLYVNTGTAVAPTWTVAGTQT